MVQCNLATIGPMDSEDLSFKIVDGRTDGRTTDGQTIEPAYPISSQGASGSGELEVKTHLHLLQA